MKTLIVIPARIGSSRFPRKPFAKICGVSLLERVWKIGKAVKSGSTIVVATDSTEVVEFVKAFGGDSVLTAFDCRTGTDRAWAACREVESLFTMGAGSEHTRSKFDVVVSLQGDAVLTPPWVVDSIIKEVQSSNNIKIATPAIKLTGKSRDDFIKIKATGSSTGTTVVFNKNNDALYFSKALIPNARSGGDYPLYRHVGIYAYRRETIQAIAEMDQTTLEITEQLEQLRVLENNIPIRVVEVDYRGRTHASVDNPEDIQIVEEIISREGELV